ncbi:hypothetical protein BUE76_00995 [Cnuella takakiae]|nr:hypothetical protein BUE76_00995 [Cnuella takakiae]
MGVNKAVLPLVAAGNEVGIAHVQQQFSSGQQLRNSFCRLCTLVNILLVNVQVLGLWKHGTK